MRKLFRFALPALLLATATLASSCKKSEVDGLVVQAHDQNAMMAIMHDMNAMPHY